MNKSAFEGVEFHEIELRASNDKPPFGLAQGTSDLDESKKVKLILKDDVSAFLTGKLDPKKRTPLCYGCHKVESCVLADGALEDLMQWTMPTMSTIQRKPCKTTGRTLNTTEFIAQRRKFQLEEMRKATSKHPCS